MSQKRIAMVALAGLREGRAGCDGKEVVPKHPGCIHCYAVRIGCPT